MEKLINVTGSIAKTEKLVPVKANILENTCVAEATSPYAHYYGQVPQKPKPNSLFLFTTKFYFLEEIMGFAQAVEKCLLEKINIASAVLELKGKQYPAIRIKNFPDYSQLPSLQSCLTSQGVEFTPKLNLQGELKSRISKLFVLKELAPGFYSDATEENKGYFTIDKKLSTADFESILMRIRNNSVCKLFDAEHGEILNNGEVIEIVRVFAESLELPLIKCVKEQFEKMM
ncbi:MAG: hypothetical protein ABFS16_14145 [Bacteroidota bacterium]